MRDKCNICGKDFFKLAYVYANLKKFGTQVVPICDHCSDLLDWSLGERPDPLVGREDNVLRLELEASGDYSEQAERVIAAVDAVITYVFHSRAGSEVVRLQDDHPYNQDEVTTRWLASGYTAHSGRYMDMIGFADHAMGKSWCVNFALELCQRVDDPLGDFAHNLGEEVGKILNEAKICFVEVHREIRQFDFVVRKYGEEK